MRILNSYIITVSVLLLATTVILAAAGQADVSVYYSLYIIEAFITTELYVYLNSRAQRALTGVSFLLLAGFLIIVVQQVVEILR